MYPWSFCEILIASLNVFENDVDVSTKAEPLHLFITQNKNRTNSSSSSFSPHAYSLVTNKTPCYQATFIDKTIIMQRHLWSSAMLRILYFWFTDKCNEDNLYDHSMAKVVPFTLYSWRCFKVNFPDEEIYFYGKKHSSFYVSLCQF